MVSFFEEYIRWAARKGADKALVIEDTRFKWKRILDATIGDPETLWKLSLILGAINLAEGNLENSVSQAQ